jgi:hypothetical protein
MTVNERKLRDLAINDPIMHQLLGAYDAGYFKSWEDFLFNAVLTMAEVKNSLHKHILEQEERKGPPPIVINMTPEQVAALLTDLKR